MQENIFEDTKELLKKLDEIIKIRENKLIEIEKILVYHLNKGNISLFNLCSRKTEIIKTKKLHENIAFSCKLIRRNLFFLHIRRRQIICLIEKNT